MSRIQSWRPTLPGQNAGFLGASYDPFQVHIARDGRLQNPSLAPPPGIAPDRYRRFRSLVGRFNHELSRLDQTAELGIFNRYQQQALELLSRPSVQAAFELERETPATHDAYGRNRHGQSVLLARRLVEAGARFVTVYWGKEPQDWADGQGERLANNPWDTHRNHFPLVEQSLAPRADAALAALLRDLDQRGMLGETLVVWMGDFGRTPRIDRKYASRDHWPHAFTVIVAGAGLPGGTIYGATDQHAASVTSDPVSPADLTATIFDALGVDPAIEVPGPGGKKLAMSPGRPLARL